MIDYVMHESGKMRKTALIDAVWEAFAEYLRARGHRVTHTRWLVVRHVMGRTDHFRADDVALDLARGEDRVSRTTVNNTLSLMLRAGLLRGIRDGDVHTHYEAVWDGADHAHMICDRCGRFIEFRPQCIGKAVTECCASEDFEQRAHSLVVFGRCAECAKKAEA